MSSWIDKLKEEHIAEQQRQTYRNENFGPMAWRHWQKLCEQLRNDVARLNADLLPIMKGKIEINRRELIPDDGEIDIDKLTFPAIYLSVHLDTGTESIRIDQMRKETPEGNYEKTTSRLRLELADNGNFFIKDRDGKPLSIEQASEYILRRFVD
jgi:hypothetical protein